jgi:hypothetical protein
MKLPRDITAPEFIERLLPALRMMARFPTRSFKVVSFETGIGIGDLRAWVTARGRPTQTDT